MTGPYVTTDMLENPANKASFVPEHKQFIELMYDFQADAQRQWQDELKNPSNSIGKLQCASSQPQFTVRSS
jgi:hypothetical protein